MSSHSSKHPLITELLQFDPSLRDTIDDSVDMLVDDHPPKNQDLGSQHPSKQKSRFAKPVQIENYIYEHTGQDIITPKTV